MQHGEKMASLYVFFGLIASGKSTLAEQFSMQYGFPYFNTDRVRKELAGIDPVSRQSDQFNQGIYTQEFSRKTYQAMLNMAAVEIRSGCRGVVLDGSYDSIDERARVVELSAGLDTDCVFVHCVCSEDTVRERLELRSRDPNAVSDGRWEIYTVQKEKFQPPAELDPSRLVTLDTEQNLEALLEKLATTLDML